MWNLIVSVPDHCLFFYFDIVHFKVTTILQNNMPFLYHVSIFNVTCTTVYTVYTGLETHGMALLNFNIVLIIFYSHICSHSGLASEGK